MEEPEPEKLSEETLNGRRQSSERDTGLPELGLRQSRDVTREIERAQGEDDLGISRTSYWELIWERIRPNFILDHLDWASFKITSRTWLHTWILIVFCVIDKTGHFLGTTTYLTNVACLVDPAGGASVAAALFGTTNNMLFICYAFLHSCISSAINWRLRGYLTKQDVMDELVRRGECTPKDTICMQLALLDGRYLTTRTTVVTIFGIAFCVTFAGWASLQRSYLHVPSIFCMITALICGIYTNYVPYYDPWKTGYNVVVPFGIAAAMKAFLSAVYLPFTSSYRYVSVVGSVGESIKKISDQVFDFQVTVRPSDPQFGKIIDEIPARLDRLPGMFTKMQLDLLISGYEVQYSRFDYSDLNEFRTRSIAIVNILRTFKFFFAEFKERIDEAKGETSAGKSKESSPETTAGAPKRKYTFDYPGAKPYTKWVRSKTTRQYKHTSDFEIRRRQKYLGNFILGLEARISTAEVDLLFVSIVTHYQPVLSSAQKVLANAVRWIQEANEFRTITLLFPKKYEKCLAASESAHDDLHRAVYQLLEVYRKTVDSGSWLANYRCKENLNQYQFNYALAQDAFYGFLCKEYARLTRKLAKWCLYIDVVQQRPRLKTFMSTQHRKKLKHYKTSPAELDKDLDQPTGHDTYHPLHSVQARNVDSTPPRNAFHLLGMKVYTLQEHLWSDDAQYGLKRAWTVIIPVIPYFVRSSLRFAYGNRVVWAAILTGMTMTPRPSDTMYQLVSRIVFTFIGGVIGMVAWYISAGNGNGNAFGYAAVYAVLLWYMVYYRHFVERATPTSAIVFSMTIFLVTGTSWLHAHGNSQGFYFTTGFSVAWRRFVTVVVGVTIAYIGTLFPHPRTGKKALRRILGSCLQTVGTVQASLLNFSLQRYDDPDIHAAPIKDVVILQVRACYVKLAAADMLQKTLQFEPPLTGVWPRNHYQLLIKLEKEVVHLLPCLYSLINTLDDPEKMPELINKLGWSNPRILSGVYAVIYMSSRGITSGEPLPSVTPGRLTEEYQTHLRELLVSHWKTGNPADLIARDYRDHDGRFIMAAIKLASLLYERLDGIIMLVKSLVGECYDTDSRLFDWNIEPHTRDEVIQEE